MAEHGRRHLARGATWGRIVNVSTGGSASFPGEISYGASKYAMESYSRAAAWELGRLEMSHKHPIPTLANVLDEFIGQLGLEIELKGPEPQAPIAVASVLAPFHGAWSTLEITSFQPALLAAIRDRCPGIATALLFPASERWMRPDVVAYAALQYARLARADAVHLDPSQLSDEVAATVRTGGIEIHAHSVNDDAALALVADLRLPWVSTDQPERALAFRRARV